MTLAHPVEGEAMYLRRPAEEFPRAPALIASLRRAIDGRVGRPLSYHVVGGFARACVTGAAFRDVDVVAAARGDRAALLSLAGSSFEMVDASGRVVRVRLDVARRVVPSPAALIAGIELVMARLAFSTTDECFHLDPECLEALATRTMSLRPVDHRFVSAARTIRRTLKYAGRGYRLPMEALLETIQEYRRTPALLRWGDYRLRTFLQRPSGGEAEPPG